MSGWDTNSIGFANGAKRSPQDGLSVFGDPFDPLQSDVRAPGLLWLLGERGQKDICVLIARDPSGRLMPASEADLARAKELFPEATISSYWQPRAQPAATTTSAR